MQGKRLNTRALGRYGQVVGALAFSALTAPPVWAQPVGVFSPASDGYMLDEYAIVDVRTEDECLDAALPGSRCLPASWILQGEEGAPISFHALRWLLGTIGLSGQEALIIYAGPDPTQDDAWAVAAMIYLAGQSLVFVYDATVTPNTENGESRSFSREVIYTAPMRSELMEVAGSTSLRSELIRFARQGGTIAFAPDA